MTECGSSVTGRPAKTASKSTRYREVAFGWFSFCAFCVSTVQLQDFEAERLLPKKSFAAWHFGSNPPMCLGHADLHRESTVVKGSAGQRPKKR